MNNETTAGGRDTRFLFVVLLAGVGLRCYQLGGQIVADDEWHALHKLLSSTYGNIATHFGYADHSIPLTLYYKLLADTIGLAEWGMRLPPLLAGIAAMIVLPAIVRPYLDRHDRSCFAALIAVSPLLIYFSRTARPYSLVVLAGFLALAAAYRWWVGGERHWAILYVTGVAAAGYLHPVSLGFTLAPLLFFGIESLLGAGRGRRPLLRVLRLGAVAAVPLLALLGPPLYVDHSSLALKSGVQSVSWYAASGAVHHWIGSGSRIAVVVVLAVAAIGAVRLGRSNRRLVAYFLMCTACLILAIVVSRGAHLGEPLVLARYTLPAMPVLLMLVAVGLGEAARRSRVAIGGMVVAAGTALALVLLGPLPAQLYRPNQFMGHMVYQFDYRDDLNGYREYRPQSVPEFYRVVGARRAASLTLIEAPWRFEWDYNVLNFYQQVHHQSIKVGFLGSLCGQPTRGEYPPAAAGMRFRHFVDVAQALEQGAEAGDFIVFHLTPPWPPNAPRPPVERCVARFAERYGDPFYADDEIVVFALGDEVPIGG